MAAVPPTPAGLGLHPEEQLQVGVQLKGRVATVPHPSDSHTYSREP